MSINDALSNAREVARAQAQEDFEFFAQHVCGLRTSREICVAVQNAILSGGEISGLSFSHPLHKLAAEAWAGIVSKGPMVKYPSETFEWLFGEVEEAAA